jgi:hypothetical protein
MPVGSRLGLLARILLSTSVFAAAPTAPVLAQSGGVWIAGGGATRGASELVTDLDPPRLFGLEGAGSGAQRVDAGRTTSPAIEAGAQWFPLRHVGFEVWVGRDAGEADAASSPYHTTLTYIARQPPDHVPRTYEYDRATDWPPATLEIRRWTVGFNGVWRPLVSPRVSWNVAGGLAWIRLSGDAAPLGFTTFSLGGHSVLFPNEYRLAVALDPASAWRANAGTTVDVRLASHLALVLGARAVVGPDRDLRLRVTGVDRSQAGFEPPSTAEIDDALAESAASVSTRSFRALVGLKALF